MPGAKGNATVAVDDRAAAQEAAAAAKATKVAAAKADREAKATAVAEKRAAAAATRAAKEEAPSKQGAAKAAAAAAESAAVETDPKDAAAVTTGVVDDTKQVPAAEATAAVVTAAGDNGSPGYTDAPVPFPAVSLGDTSTTVYALGPAAAYARLQAAGGGYRYGNDASGGMEGQRFGDLGPPPPPPPALYDSRISVNVEESVSEVVDVDALFQSEGQN
ncbi:hypothetical protein MMPV_008064 [Pyropia vietnamensis]